VFVADAATIWNYLLVSTKTGTGEQWAHGASTRDTQPTETPASDEYSEYQWDGSFDDLTGESPSTSESEK